MPEFVLQHHIRHGRSRAATPQLLHPAPRTPQQTETQFMYAFARLWGAGCQGLLFALLQAQHSEVLRRQQGSEAAAAFHLEDCSQPLLRWGVRLAEQLEHGCPFCGHRPAPGDVQYWPSARCIRYVTLFGNAQVLEPRFMCRGACAGAETCIHPVAMQCFPATPTDPGTYIDEAIMVLLVSTREAAPFSTSAVQVVLQSLQAFHSGCDDEVKQRFTDELTHAGIVYSLLQRQLHTCAWAELRPVIGGGFTSCSACWREAHTVMGDACMGLRRLKGSAVSARGVVLPSDTAHGGLQPLAGGGDGGEDEAGCGLFVPDVVLLRQLQQLRCGGAAAAAAAAGSAAAGGAGGVPAAPAAVRSAACTMAGCSTFKADTLYGGKLDARYDRLGVAAVACRHGVVMSACSLFTQENHSYHIINLARMVRGYYKPEASQAPTEQHLQQHGHPPDVIMLSGAASPSPGSEEEQPISLLPDPSIPRRIRFFFLDVGCKFGNSMQTLLASLRQAPEPIHVPEEDLCVLVGKWHLRAHVPMCRLLFSGEFKQGAGLAYGEQLEQIWAVLRPYNAFMVNMGDANRQDMLSLLISHITDKKVKSLARQLRAWYTPALRLINKLTTELQREGKLPIEGSPCLLTQARQRAAEATAQQQCALAPRAALILCLERLRFATGAGLHLEAEAASLQQERAHLQRRAEAGVLPERGTLTYNHHLQELKLDELRRAQESITQLLVAFRAYDAVTSRAGGGRSRHFIVRAQEFKVKLRQQLRHAVLWLQHVASWPDVAGATTPRYKAQQLNSETWLRGGDTSPEGGRPEPWPPWVVEDPSSVALVCPDQQKQQRLLRAREEVELIKREAQDMVAYYMHCVAETLTALQVQRELLVVLGPPDAPPPPPGDGGPPGSAPPPPPGDGGPPGSAPPPPPWDGGPPGITVMEAVTRALRPMHSAQQRSAPLVHRAILLVQGADQCGFQQTPSLFVSRLVYTLSRFPTCSLLPLGLVRAGGANQTHVVNLARDCVMGKVDRLNQLLEEHQAQLDDAVTLQTQVEGELEDLPQVANEPTATVASDAGYESDVSLSEEGSVPSLWPEGVFVTGDE